MDIIVPIIQDDFVHTFVKDELDFVLKHSKTDKDAELENNEDMKEVIMSLHSLLKMPSTLVNSPLQLPSPHERVFCLTIAGFIRTVSRHGSPAFDHRGRVTALF